MNEPLYTYEKFKRKIIFYNDRMIVHKGVIKEIHYEDIIKINRKSEHLISLQLPDKKRPYRLPIRSDDDEVFELLIKFLENFGREFVEIQGERELKSPVSDYFEFKPKRHCYFSFFIGLAITLLSLFQSCYFIGFGLALLAITIINLLFEVRSLTLKKSTLLIKGFCYKTEVPYEKIGYVEYLMGSYNLGSKSFVVHNTEPTTTTYNLKQSLFYHGAPLKANSLNLFCIIISLAKLSVSFLSSIGSALLTLVTLIPLTLLVGGLFFDADPELWKVNRKISSDQNNYYLYSSEIDRALRKVEDLHLTKKE